MDGYCCLIRKSLNQIVILDSVGITFGKFPIFLDMAASPWRHILRQIQIPGLIRPQQHIRPDVPEHPPKVLNSQNDQSLTLNPKKRPKSRHMHRHHPRRTLSNPPLIHRCKK